MSVCKLVKVTRGFNISPAVIIIRVDKGIPYLCVSINYSIIST